MDANKLYERISEHMQERLGKGYRVKLRMAGVYNGAKEPGLEVRKEAGGKYGMVINLVGVYELYRREEMTTESECAIDKIISKMLNEYWKAEEISDDWDKKEKDERWEAVRNHVYPILLPLKANGQLLTHLVWKRMEDLAVIYTVCFETYSGRCSTHITCERLADWGISPETLHEFAIENMRKEGYCMTNILRACFLPFCKEKIEKMEKDFLYVFTSRTLRFGAASILDTDKLFEVTDGRDAYILPSSLYEVILALDEGEMNAEFLTSMVREVNRAVVPRSQWLEDHLYYFDAKRRTITALLPRNEMIA